MCSIFGALGTHIPYDSFAGLRERAADRGRDGGRIEHRALSRQLCAIVGNWRATPTTELQHGRLQPYDGLVHNGTIANADELGLRPGEIDSEVLPRVLDRTSLTAFRDSLRRVVGSYAIAAITSRSIFLACNYKPLYYYRDEHETGWFSSMERHLTPLTPYGVRPARMAPYSVMDLATGATFPLRPEPPKKAVVICSGGLDSTTVAAKLLADGYEVALLHFLYGCNAQSHEIDAVTQLAQFYRLRLALLPLDYRQIGASPLFDPTNPYHDGIPGAEFAHEWVPARNLVMLATATAWAEAHDYHYVALGNNLEESGAYPDNEEEFTFLFNQVADYAVRSGYTVRVIWPVGNLMKHEIVALGLRLQVPFELTWSCYAHGATHCGHCGPCYMRREAFLRNGTRDPVFA